MLKETSKQCNESCEKDFCKCLKESLKAHKKETDARRVSKVEWFLRDNRIDYYHTRVSNVVNVNTSQGKIYVSLKSHDNLIKVKFENSKHWYTYSFNKFKNKFG